MAARNVNLTNRLAAFLEAQVRNGRHQNAGEVVREALRRYEAALAAETHAVATIRTVAREAFASGALPGPVPPKTLEAIIGCPTRTERTGSKP